VSDSFDIQAAWLRRLQADAEGNLRAFALRLREALPDKVEIHEKRGLFSRAGTITGLTIRLAGGQYTMAIEGGQLRTSVATIVRGVRIGTKELDPAAWFAKLRAETAAATADAKRLSDSLSAFLST
jgi:hypothetical protein